MRTWLAATAAAVLLTGCGTAAAKPVTGQPRGRGVGRPVPRSCARARVAARRRAQPAAGNEDGSPREAAAAADQPQAPLQPGWVRVTDTLEAPAEPQSVWQAMLTRTSLRDLTSALPWHGPDRGHRRGSLAPGPARCRAPGPGQLPVRHDLGAVLAVPRNDTHVYQPGGHRQAGVHHQRRLAGTPVRGGGYALCPGGHRLHPPVRAPGRRETVRRHHARRLPARLRRHGQRQAAVAPLGQQQATHRGRHPAWHPPPARCLTMPTVFPPPPAAVHRSATRTAQTDPPLLPYPLTRADAGQCRTLDQPLAAKDLLRLRARGSHPGRLAWGFPSTTGSPGLAAAVGLGSGRPRQPARPRAMLETCGSAGKGMKEGAPSRMIE